MMLDETTVAKMADLTYSPAAKSVTDHYGTVQSVGDEVEVLIDGASESTPCVMGVTCKQGDRVTVRIENSEAKIINNITSPATDDTNATAPVHAIVVNDSTVEQSPSGQFTPMSITAKALCRKPVDGVMVSSEYSSGNIFIEVSADGLQWYPGPMAEGSTVSADYSALLELCAGMRYVRVTLTDVNANQLARGTVSIVQATGNYLYCDDTGLYVLSKAGTTDSGPNVRVSTSSGVEIRDGSSSLTSVSKDGVRVGPIDGTHTISNDARFIVANGAQNLISLGGAVPKISIGNFSIYMNVDGNLVIDRSI